MNMTESSSSENLRIFRWYKPPVLLFSSIELKCLLLYKKGPIDRITTMEGDFNGTRYEGDFKDDKCHGKGVYTWPEIESYFQSFPRINEYSDGTSIL
jgi:hypothetical protein